MLIEGNKNVRDKISYAGGLTKPMISDIRRVDVFSVQTHFLQHNINTNFEGNKFLAWASVRVFEVLKGIQKQFNLNLGMPKNILVEDFSKLKINNYEKTYGFTNLVPCRLHKASENVTPSFSIIFQKGFPWEKIDEISDADFYQAKNTTTDFFLESIFHEFAHIIHLDSMLKKFGVDETLKRLLTLTNEANVRKYHRDFGDIVEANLCKYAAKEPLDLVGCDISKRVISSIDRDKIFPTANPFADSPYEATFAVKHLFQVKNPLDILIRQVYQGKMPKTN